MPQPTDRFWAQTLYSDSDSRPPPNAPLRDLPVRAARRFRRVREGLHQLQGVTEQVVYQGRTWKWVWLFEVGGRKVVYLHPMTRGLSATFVVGRAERPHFDLSALPEAARSAFVDGEEDGGTRWCWMDLPNMAAVDALLEAVRLKHRILASAA